jgi:lysozyme family protein
MTLSPEGRRQLGRPEVKWDKEVERAKKQWNLKSDDVINRQLWRLKISNRWNTRKLIGIKKYLPSSHHKDGKQLQKKCGKDVGIITVDRKMSELIDESTITDERSALTEHNKSSLNAKEEIFFSI